MSRVDDIIDKISLADDAEIINFDFGPCFSLMREMEEAMTTFVERVDSGEVRSRKTYTKFKEILGL